MSAADLVHAKISVGEVEALRERAGQAEARVAELEALTNSPETDDWLKGARLEAAHQVERWGAQHDAGKSAWDWFWLIGYLAQKAAAAQLAGDTAKARHHTISTAAALLNWHRHLSGADQRMRPGIDPVERGIEPAPPAPAGGRSPTDGKPFYCVTCGAGRGEYGGCEMPDCQIESAEAAQARAARGGAGR